MTVTASRLAARWSAVLLLAATVLAAPPPQAGAASDGACRDGEGITVVVDFRSLGGDMIVRCVPPDTPTGFDVLRAAGIAYTTTQRFPGFLCRIEGVPADDPCVNTPAPDYYWGYWRADYGGEWAYSRYGAGTTSPPPGPVEGWSFSNGDDLPPGMDPPPAAEPEPTPSPTATPTVTPPPEPTPAPTPSPTSAPTTAPAGAVPAPTPSASAAPTASETEAPSAAASPSRASPRPAVPPTPTEDATPSSTPTDLAGLPAADERRGPPLGTLFGILLVLAVATGAVAASRRRTLP